MIKAVYKDLLERSLFLFHKRTGQIWIFRYEATGSEFDITVLLKIREILSIWYELVVQYNLDLVTLNLVTTCDLEIERVCIFSLVVRPKLYIPSTLNIDLIQWHTHWIVCAVK